MVANLTRYKLEWFNRTQTMDNFHQMVANDEGDWVKFDDIKELLNSSHNSKSMPLQKELESLINCHCAENESDTPDFILAAYLSDCLAAFNRSVNMREAWYGRKTQEL